MGAVGPPSYFYLGVFVFCFPLSLAAITDTASVLSVYSIPFNAMWETFSNEGKQQTEALRVHTCSLLELNTTDFILLF